MKTNGLRNRPAAYRIAVVGLGVAGSTAAWMLARQGHRVEVFEQAPSVGPVGAGVLLQPSGQLVLKELGIFDEITARSERIDRLTALTHRRRTLIDLPYAEVADGCCAFGVHRGVLFESLYRRVCAEGVPVHLGKRIVRLDGEPGAINVRDSLGNEYGKFDFVIAADGSRSAIGNGRGVRRCVYQYPHGALWTMGDRSPFPNQLWQMTRGTHALCGLLPTGAGQCSLFWSIENQAVPAMRRKGIEAWKREVAMLCPEAEPLLQSIRTMEQLRFVTYRHVYMPRPFDCAGRCMWIGDAAHAMSPHLGQGINLALLDAFALAGQIGECASPLQAFTRTWEARRGHTSVYAALTAALSPFFQSRGFIKGIGRDIALPLMPRVPLLRRRMVTTMAGLRGGFLRRELTFP